MRLRRTGILTKLILLVLLVYLLTSLASLQKRIKYEERETAELQQQLEDMETENDNMRYAVEHSEDDDVIRDIAREKLDLVEQGEEIFYAE